MKQRENIFEELDKMKYLINAKAGIVISEQANASSDVGTIMKELNNFNSDESKIVNIIKKYKDKASFKVFMDQYKTISGKDFGVDVFKAITPSTDRVEWNDLKTHLATLGVDLTSQTKDPRQGESYAIFGGLDTQSTPAASSRQKNINSIYCSVKNGIIINPASKNNNKTFESYKTLHKLTDAEIATAKKSCTSGGGRSNRGGGTNVVSDYSKQIQTSLGSSSTGKISSQDLDLILKKLNGEDVNVEVSQELPTNSNGKPDLDKILASLQS